MNMVAPLIDISDCPFSGMKRKAKRGEYSDTPTQIYLQVFVDYYDSNGNKVEAKGITGFERRLTAVNETVVDVTTGDIATEATPEQNKMGELDYLRLIPVQQNMVGGTLAGVNESLYGLYILKADGRGQFDNQ